MHVPPTCSDVLDTLCSLDVTVFSFTNFTMVGDDSEHLIEVRACTNQLADS